MDELDSVWITELLFAIDAHTGQIVDAMGDIEACLGLTPELLVGQSLVRAVHRDDLPGAQQAIERTILDGRSTWQGRVQHVNGTFVEYAWEGRLGTDRSTIYARGRDAARARASVADVRVFERLADLSTDLFLVLDNRGRILRVNRAALQTHNQTERDLIGAELLSFVPESSHHILNQIPGQLAEHDHPVNFRVPAFDGRGGQVIMEGSATFDPITDRWYVVERDVTERVAHEHELEVAQRFFELSASQLVLVDCEDRILRANAAFLEAVGLPTEQIIGSDVVETIRASRGAALRRTLHEVRTTQTVDRREVGVTLRDESSVLDVHFAPARDGQSVYLSARDITEERMLQHQLLQRATRDGLTGLVNRSTLVESIRADLDRDQLTAFVMLDLDGFKQVNDSMGHAAGDELLVAIGERLSARTRRVDLVARFGGDEFAVLLRGVPDGSTALLVAEKLRQAVREPFEVLGRPLSVTASVGVTIGRRATHTSEQLLIEADLAAYSAKERGADQSRMFDDALRASADFAHAVEEHLRRVLDAPVFELEVVPVEDLQGRTVGVGVTAPAIAISGQRRWNAQTMAVAKRLGLLGPLTIRLASESIAGLADWLIPRPEAYLDIVVDVIEIEVTGFAPQFLGLLEQHGVPPGQLVVSLTGIADTGIQAVELEAIDELRRAGVRVSFSASRADTSTLSALHLQCIDRIDVDTSRVALAPEGSIDRLIASTVFDVADRLGVEIVADASFAPDVVDTVSIFPNCAPVGLVFGRPVPITEFMAEASSSEVAGPGSAES